MLRLLVLGLLLGAAASLAPLPAAARSSPLESEQRSEVVASDSVSEQLLSRVQLHPAFHSQLIRPVLFDNLKNPHAGIALRAQETLKCAVCKGLASTLLPLLDTKLTESLVVDLAIGICNKMRPLCHTPSACAAVCNGIVGEMKDQVFSELFSAILTPPKLCYALKSCPAPPPPAPSTRIPVRSNLRNAAGEIAWGSWARQAGRGHFVHLSDAHLDLTYQVGASTNCGYPVCCHATDGAPANDSMTAGPFGSDQFDCDSPVGLAQDLLDHLAQLDPQPDFILYTGDDPSHDVWKQSRTENLAALGAWSGLLNSTIRGIPIFHTLGNHEIFPINQFAGPGFDDWLYSAAVQNWAPFLPEDAQATLAYGGYYQARVRPGLRVISLNSNYFTDDNYWLLANQTDAQDQLNWLADVLQQAQELGERCILICHAPLASWNNALAEAYLTIAERYQQTIVNLFMGHTHNNEYQTLHTVTASGAPGTPMHVAYIGGSIVPYSNVNTGFTMYEYNREEVAAVPPTYTTLVVQTLAFWIDNAKANAANSTAGMWDVVQYNMTEALGVESLDAATLSALAPSYVTNPSLYQAYIRSMFKGALPSASDAPSPKGVACATSTDTDSQLHACWHQAGHTENDIKAIQERARHAC